MKPKRMAVKRKKKQAERPRSRKLKNVSNKIVFDLNDIKAVTSENEVITGITLKDAKFAYIVDRPFKPTPKTFIFSDLVKIKYIKGWDQMTWEERAQAALKSKSFPGEACSEKIYFAPFKPTDDKVWLIAVYF